MVSFILVADTEETATYRYFPEGDERNACGVVTLFKETGAFEITKLAPKDFSRHVTLEEVKALRDSVNAERIAAGLSALTEDDWQMPTKGFVTTFYADHVIAHVREAFEQGTLLRAGKAAWY